MIQAFVGGNITAKDAKASLELIEMELPGSSCSLEEIMPSRLISFDNQRPMLNKMPVETDGNACMLGIYSGRKTDATRVGMELLSKLIKEPFYSDLRTKQQTGYIVDSGMYELRKRLFLYASVQSNAYDARDLLARIELFMENFLRDMHEDADMSNRFGKFYLFDYK